MLFKEITSVYIPPLTYIVNKKIIKNPTAVNTVVLTEY
jgi:hypothetical protein